jgi:lysozyme
MQISENGLDLIKAFEGFFAKPYRCPAGVMTQGYGHTAAAGAPALGGVWSKERATQVLRDDVARFSAKIEPLFERRPSQAQFDAMISLAYNIGPRAFAGSSVLRTFNARDDKRAAAAFAMWVKGGGKILPGLVRRRASEALAYQGVRDLDFDGKADAPAFGRMAQAVASIEPRLSKAA